jgi:hypothetical protein
MAELEDTSFIPIFNTGIISPEKVAKHINYIKTLPIKVVGGLGENETLIAQFWNNSAVRINPLGGKVEYDGWKEVPNSYETPGGGFTLHELNNNESVKFSYMFNKRPIKAICSFHNSDIMKEGEENSAAYLSGRDLLNLLGSH